LLITRRRAYTFSIANDRGKYFAIIPAMFAAAFPQLNVLNVMHLVHATVRHSVGGQFLTRSSLLR